MSIKKLDEPLSIKSLKCFFRVKSLKSIFERSWTQFFWVLFKIERWNIQVQFEIGFRETSQNFNSFSFFRQLLFSSFFYWLSDWVEILRGFTKFNFKLNLKVSAFYLEKQKSFIPKKNVFWSLSISKQKSFVYWLNFPEGFGSLCHHHEKRKKDACSATERS